MGCVAGPSPPAPRGIADSRHEAPPVLWRFEGPQRERSISGQRIASRKLGTTRIRNVSLRVVTPAGDDQLSINVLVGS